MTDNEERIYIGIINPKGDFCPVPVGGCNSFCDCCNGGLTRQEAAEKIKDALTYYAWYYDLQNTRNKTETYWLIAQAILHSILGEKNERKETQR